MQAPLRFASQQVALFSQQRMPYIQYQESMDFDLTNGHT